MATVISTKIENTVWRNINAQYLESGNGNGQMGGHWHKQINQMSVWSVCEFYA